MRRGATETGARGIASALRRQWRLRAEGLVGRTGFEPVKASATRFTVWPLWPLGYLPGSNPVARAALGAAEQRGDRRRCARDPMCGANAARAPRLSSAGPCGSRSSWICLVATERGLRAPTPRNSGARLRSLSGWSQRWDSNPQPPDYKSGAQPVELRWRGSSADAQRASRDGAASTIADLAIERAAPGDEVAVGREGRTWYASGPSAQASVSGPWSG